MSLAQKVGAVQDASGSGQGFVVNILALHFLDLCFYFFFVGSLWQQNFRIVVLCVYVAWMTPLCQQEVISV